VRPTPALVALSPASPPRCGRRADDSSLSRSARYKIKDIRTLVGHKVDVEGVKKAAAVRLDKGVVSA
jgi:hypothetical protein